jgi:hypothetical protein
VFVIALTRSVANDRGPEIEIEIDASAGSGARRLFRRLPSKANHSDDDIRPHIDTPSLHLTTHNGHSRPRRGIRRGRFPPRPTKRKALNMHSIAQMHAHDLYVPSLPKPGQNHARFTSSHNFSKCTQSILPAVCTQNTRHGVLPHAIFICVRSEIPM